MDLGLIWGHWDQVMPDNFVEITVEAESAGFDAVWVPSSWGSDAKSPVALLAAHTERIRLGTNLAPVSLPTVESFAHRTIIGLGATGLPRVEDRYSLPSKQLLADTREYVTTLRQAMAHLWREMPIWIGAEGRRNVSQTVEIADGWFPLCYSPWRAEVYHDQIKDRKLGFEIAVSASMKLHKNVEEALWPTKIASCSYTSEMAQMGYEADARKVQGLLREGQRDEAIRAVPTEFVDEISLVGSEGRIRDRLQAWEESAVTMINVAPRTVAEIWQIAELVKG